MPAATGHHLAPSHEPAAGLTNARGGGTPHSISPDPRTGINPQSSRRLVHSRRLHASSQAPHKLSPPVSPRPAPGVLRTLSPPTASPTSTRKAAAGLYRAGGGKPCPKRHTHPRRQSHQRRRPGYSELSFHPPPLRHQSAKPPPACTKRAASRLVLSATHTPAAGLTNAGRRFPPHSLSPDPPTLINPQSRRRLIHSRRRHALSEAPHTPPPPVSPAPAADALHTLSSSTRLPGSTRRAATGLYPAGGVTPHPK